MASASIVAQACLFILAGGEHTPELRKSTQLRRTRLLFPRNTVQDEGEGGRSAPPKTAQRQHKLGQIWSHSELMSAPTSQSEWPHTIKARRKAQMGPDSLRFGDFHC